MDKLSPERRGWLMSRVKSKNTAPELVVRHLIFDMGYRYRLYDKRLPGKPDFVLPSRRRAIFVNGCFWHGHAGCRYARLPKTRVDFWRNKIERNHARDLSNVDSLVAGGWKVLVVWQCELKNIKVLTEKLHDFIEND